MLCSTPIGSAVYANEWKNKRANAVRHYENPHRRVNGKGLWCRGAQCAPDDPEGLRE
jgi:hypothetical protein